MKNRLLIHFLRAQEGQSLMEIIIGLGIGAILIGTASFGIAFTLRSTTANQSLAGASQLTQGVLDNVQSFSNANWQNIYNLGKTSSNQYFLVASGTAFLAVRGDEGIAGDDVTSGLIGKWGFDEDAASTSTLTYDATGNGDNGTLINGTSRASSTCKIANCMSFNATSSNYIDVPSTSTLNFTTNGTFSISVWVNPNTFSGTWRRGIMRQESYLTSGYRFGFSTAGQPLFWTTQSGGTLNLSGSVNLTLNQWNHLVVTYNNQQAYLYLNGAQIGSATGTYIAGSNPVLFGYIVSEYFSGLLDDVRYYNRALSAGEVTQLYNSQVFKRYFYVDDVCRTDDSSGDISSSTTPCASGTTNDPLTQKITAIVQWSAGAGNDEVSLSRYVTRWSNFSFHQTDWSGGSGQDGPLTNPNDEYFSGSNIITTSTLGSFQIQNLSQQ